MQPSPRSDVFIRHLVDAATARPLLNRLLEMKQGRVFHAPAVVVAPTPAPERIFPLRHPQAA
ncbi:MAG: hypothetical protein H0T76_18130 [Nannocystis sp.]|nr:hypothetical protein [Nannocystis sp.]MBA3548405.1 hypothetical protein [Nannocystis sp.]